VSYLQGGTVISGGGKSTLLSTYLQDWSFSGGIGIWTSFFSVGSTEGTRSRSIMQEGKSFFLKDCWEQAFFEEIPNFGKERPNFGEEQPTGKETRARKICMQRKKTCKMHRKENLTMLGLGFWKKIIMVNDLVI
jgi:hypothetical protein